MDFICMAPLYLKYSVLVCAYNFSLYITFILMYVTEYCYNGVRTVEYTRKMHHNIVEAVSLIRVHSYTYGTNNSHICSVYQH